MIRSGTCLALMVLAGAAQAQQTDWVPLADACIRDLPNRGSTAALVESCPEVSRALQADPWGELLIQPTDQLSPWSLVELTALAGHYRSARAGPTLSTAGLGAALAELPELNADEPPSLWERFLEWLRGWLDDDDIALPEWLDDVSLPEGSVKWILIVTGALVAILAVAIVVNEIRHLARRRRSGVAAASGRDRDDGARVPAHSSVGHSPGEQLEALFRHVVVRLTEDGMLPPRASLTHREVAAAGGVPEPQRHTLGAISGAAERVVFGAWSPAAEDVAAHLDAGRRLLDELGRTR